MKKLSIIVPVYNVEECLERCLESILAQTYMDFELLLINDGSKDRSREIMELYAKKDKRIILINQVNRGVSAARNMGLKRASGKYVCFVDSDDFIDPEFCYILISELEKTGADIACCNWDYVYDDGSVQLHEVKRIPSILSKKQFVEQLFVTPRTLGGSICNKIFLREKIEEYFDEEISVCEDNLFLMQYCINISKVCYINKNMYHIFEFAKSTMRQNTARVVYGLDTRKKIIGIAAKIDKTVGNISEKDFLDTCYLYCTQFEKLIDKKYYYYAKKQFNSYIKRNFFKVLFNNKIYWKTKLMYYIKVFINNKEQI